MGSPAARLTDRTAHGGMIVLGKLNVWINWRPAARASDPHICPPGHYFGPILPPCAANVLIGGKPAARIGDKLACGCGAPDVISSGEQKVLIGTDGSSSDPGLAAMQQVALRSAAGVVAGWSWFGERGGMAPGDPWTEQGIRDILSQTPSGREALARLPPGVTFGREERPPLDAFYDAARRQIHIPARCTNEQAASYAIHEMTHADQYRNLAPSMFADPTFARIPMETRRQMVEWEVDAFDVQLRNWEERGRPSIPLVPELAQAYRTDRAGVVNAIKRLYTPMYRAQ